MDHIINMLNSMEEKDQKKIKTSVSWLIAGSDGEPDAKLTPVQKLEKRLETTNEKLSKLNEKIAGGKSKIPDKDAENKTKFEEIISDLQAKISETSKEKPKAEKAKPEEEKPKADKKHVPRITPAMTTQLKAAIGSSELEWDDEHKKKFMTYVNALSAEEFANNGGLENHINNYVTAQNSAKAGSSTPPTKALTVPELHKQNKNLTEVSPGVYQHKTTGVQVTGPAELEDEDFEDATLGSAEYIVGQTTQRVYTADSQEFVGYWGVGKFYDASL